MRFIATLLLLAALAGCSTTGVVAPPDAPRLASPDSALLKSCELPTKLPPGDMTQRDIERYWGVDRKHQIECAKRHGALRDFIVDRDGNLRKK